MRNTMNNGIMRYNLHTVRDLLEKHGIKSSKIMGQNFLIDANIPEKIVKNSGINKTCGVLEIGPGLGALTQVLCDTAGHVTSVELDKRLVPIIREIFAEKENITIVQGDILKININEIIESTMSKFEHHVCANLPYNITTPALTAFIDSKAFKSITVMIQKEVAMRICAKPGTSDYGAFTVYANYHTLPEILFDVSPECFTPRPKVTSSVVKMKTRAESLLTGDDEKKFFKVVKAAFGQRRKTLVNALFTVFEKTNSKESIAKTVENCGFDTRIRGENLGIADFIELSSKL